MANEDPSGIPEQIRQNRPFFLVVILAVLIAIGTFVFILFMDTGRTDIGRNPVTHPRPVDDAQTPPDVVDGVVIEVPVLIE